tara:strand:- start:17435 stop:18004 length:570 start_codon:yes stop_codon:yes gene_type:complete
MINAHTFLAKLIHWIFIPLYAYGIFKQVDDLNELEDASLLYFEILFAIVFLIIVLLRYFYMKDTPTLLGAHENIHEGHLFIAKTVHGLIYFSLIMLPATGLLIAALFSLEVGGVEIAIAVHEFSAFLSYVVIALHVGASLYSRFKGEGLWNAMVPAFKETGGNSSNLILKLEDIERKTYEKIEKVFNLE